MKNDRILVLLSLVKARKSMYFAKDSFNSFADFMNGVLTAIGILSERDIYSELHNWMICRFKKEHSVGWNYFLKMEYTGLDDEQLIDKGFDYMTEFFEEIGSADNPLNNTEI